MFHKIIAIITSLLCIVEPIFAGFSDIENSYYRDAISKLSSEGIISGFPDGTFGGDKTITRAEILKIYMGAKGLNMQNTTHEKCFKDVDITRWYHSYICEGVQLGIVKGFDNQTFGPDKPVTVIEAIAIGLRLYNLTPSATTPWYKAYIEFTNSNNIMDSASYGLSTPMSRGKASDLILRIRDYSIRKTPLQNMSQGCQKPGNLLATNTVRISEKDRSYILSIPAGYRSSQALGVIVAIHGRTNSNTMVRGYMGLEGGRGGSQSDYIVAYPAGIDAGNGTRSWSSEENIVFFDTIIRDIGDNYCIDRDRIYIAAHSLGAWFASKLACVRGDMIRGMAIVGGGGWATSCNQTPTAALIYQNANDHLSSPATARTTEKIMRNTNSCGTKTEPISIGPLTCQKWQDCTTGNPVIWCEGYGSYGNDPHGWPNSGGTDILNFFRTLQ